MVEKERADRVTCGSPLRPKQGEVCSVYFSQAESRLAAAQIARRGFELISHVSRNQDWRANRRARGPRQWRR
ncbi:MAG: hypothetical protein AB7S99_23770, partial [Pseudodonghicola sp.]